MKISFNWLKEYLDFDLSPEETAKILTDTGLEVEGLNKIEAVKGGLEGVVIGEVLSKEKHPNADRLNITTVNVGNGEPLQIVCGAPNVESGQKVAVARVGCTLYPDPEKPFKIKKSKIRGVESHGMICAEDELGLGDSHDGIMVLNESAKIGQEAKEYFQLKEDYEIEIGLTPNRTDGMSHLGVARDLKAYLNFHEGAKLQIKLPDTRKLKQGSQEISIQLEDMKSCPRYSGAVIKNVKVAPSPEWLQQRLRSIGLNPVNNIVDITNFVMHECGNPLHAFDLSAVGKELIVRKAQKGEKIVTLDEEERELSTDDLMICNAEEPMCIGGVFGGIESGVSNDTNDIFLEAAYFDPVSVRKSAKRHVLNTDSSFRFERGVDPENVIWARDRAISLILDITGGELGKAVDIYPEKIERNTASIRFERCRKISGVDISDLEIESILKELDFEIEEKTPETLLLSVPHYRVDVRREADIIEEVLRIYGFNKIPLPEKMISSLTYRQKPDPEKLCNTTADLLAVNGFFEIMNNSLESSEHIKSVESQQFKENNSVRLLNPLSNELDVMRQSMLFGGMESIVYNQNRQHPDLRMFEFGKVYSKNERGYREAQHLAIWMTGSLEDENWIANDRDSSFYDLKGVVEAIFIRLGIYKNPSTSSASHELLSDGQSVSITGKEIAVLGTVRKDIQKQFGIKNSIFYAEIDWDLVLSVAKMNKIVAKELPKTQFARRDFSLLLDESVSFAEIRKIAFGVDKKILRKVGLFDVYEGKKLEKGKKSYAVSFIFQDDEKTLKDKQLDAIMENIRKGLESNLKAELR